MALNHYLGPFVESTEAGRQTFRPPGGGPWKRLILGRVAGVPWGLFSGDGVLAAPYVQVGTGDPSAVTLRAAVATTWNAELGTAIVAGASLVDAIRDTIVLVPGRDRVCKLYVAGAQVLAEHIDDLSAARRSRLLAVLGENYRRAYDDVQAGRSAATHSGKVLGDLAGVVFGPGFTTQQARSLIPGDLPGEDPRQPTTTLSDAFTYSNGELNSVSSSAWTKTGGSGAVNVSSNAIQRASGTANRYRYETDVSSANHKASIDRTAGVIGPCVRYSSSADTGYMLQVAGGAAYELWSVSAGSFTSVDSGDFGTAPGTTLTLEFDGSTYTLTDSTAGDYDTGTDSSITGGTRGGFYFDNATAAGDNWSMEDLSAGTTVAVDPVSATWSVPSVTVAKTRSASPVSATWSAVAPAVAKTRSASPVSATLSAVAPAVAKTRSATPVSATWSVPSVTVAKTRSATPVSATWSVPASNPIKLPTGSPVAATWSIVAPAIAKTVSASPVTVTWSVPSPDVEGPVTIPTDRFVAPARADAWTAPARGDRWAAPARGDLYART